MDSATSGSMQSSSGGGGGGGGGGDEEYTSQPDFLSSFLTLPPPPPQPASSFTSHLLLHHHHHHHHPSPSFDSFSTFLDPLPHPLPQNPTPSSTTNPFPHSPSPLPNATCTTTAAAQPDRPTAPGPARASKKRSRASRRPPTTVLTTDTSNFRAMVQEFTGFPAPPFSSSFARPRLDLFQSPYLLRPLAQKNHVSSFAPINTTSTPTSSSSSTAASVVDAIASIARNSLVNLNTLLASTSAASASVPIDLQHPNLPPFALQPQPAAPKEFAVGDLGSFLGSESLIRPADRTPNSLSIWADGLGLDGGDRDPLIGSGSAAAKRSTDVDKGLR